MFSGGWREITKAIMVFIAQYWSEKSLVFFFFFKWMGAEMGFSLGGGVENSVPCQKSLLTLIPDSG